MNRKLTDLLADKLMTTAAVCVSLFVFIIAFSIYLRSKSILNIKPIGDLLFGVGWSPLQGSFGFFPFIISTFYVTLLAMLFAIPISILSAIYLSEYASNRTKSIITPMIDLLAGIPPVVYGVWGMLAIVPLVSWIADLFGRHSTGFSLLAGGIVLAIMVSPTIISVTEQVLRAVPFDYREASLAMGATKWQTIKYALFRVALPGIVAAIVLGFSRAFGETMAVLMVVGNVPLVPHSVFDAAYPLPALIANNYGEMMSIPLYDSALMFAALILMLIVLIFTVAARITLMRIERRYVRG